MGAKVVFMGTPSYAVRILEKLVAEDFEICAIFTQPDKPFGRKGELKPSEIKAFASKNLPQTPIFTPNSLKNDEIAQQIHAFKADFIVVAAYGKILPKSILNLAVCVNLHASLLPKYRGASPIQSAILNGDEFSGVCAMLMDEKLDTGDVLMSEKLSIRGKKADLVFSQMSDLAAQICVKTLRNFANLKPQKQDENLASYCTKITKEQGLVGLDDAAEIWQKFLAFYPWPGVFLKSGLKFIELEFVDDAHHAMAGEILSVEKSHFLLACKRGTLKIKILQEAGKKALAATTYLNGKRLKAGDVLG